MMRNDFGTPLNIASATTTVVKKGPGILVAIIVNKALASSVYTIYDNTAASGTKIATITIPAAPAVNQFAIPYLCKFTTGLTVVTTSTDDITVVYA